MIRIYRIVFLVLVLLISYTALTPQGDISIPHIDKILHFSAFLILSLFLDLSIKKTLLSSKAGLMFLVLYALSIELVQYFLPYRSAEVFDFVSDLLGILVYLYFAPKIKIRHTR